MALIDRIFRTRDRPTGAIEAEQYVDAKLAQARELASSGAFEAALRVISRLDRLDRPELAFTRGSLLFECARFWEARRHLEFAEQSGLRGATLFAQLAWLDLWSKRAEAAGRRMREAVALDNANWRTHFGLGSSLTALGRYDAAATTFRFALDLAPGNVDCHAALVHCLLSLGNRREAEEHARRAVAVDASPMALGLLAHVLLTEDKFAEANDIFAHQGEATSTTSHRGIEDLNAGIPLRESGRVDDAVAFYRRVLPHQPDLNAHAHYAFSLLKAARLCEGWEQNEFRWTIEPLRSLRAPFPLPCWAGQDLRQQKLLVIGEQGVGDVIQFIRYAPLVKALGATVFVLLRKPMAEIVEGMAGVDAVFGDGDSLPEFDYYIHVMSLPRVFGTTLDSIPNSVPYIPLRADRVERWRTRLLGDTRKKVGLVWTGDTANQRNPYKSIPLDALAVLGAVRGVRFYALQKGPFALGDTSCLGGMDIVDLAPDIADFADTAAIIDSLDLVISICTSVAHLAGALGKPVWTLLPEPADWRWLVNRSDTPWYPTMRLFRQPKQGDWRSALDAVKRELGRFARTPKPLSATHASASRAPIVPINAPVKRDNVCRAAETRYGILQYRPGATFVDLSLDWYGEFLHAQAALLASLLSPGDVVVEVASGMGHHTLFLASSLGPEGHLFACEANAALRALLRNNLRANDATNVTVIAASLTGTDGMADDTSPGRGATSLDDLCLPRFHWLKINDETHAASMLRGCTESIWEYRPGLFLSCETFDTLHVLRGVVRDFGYHCWRIETPLFDARNFNRRTDDIFAGRKTHALIAFPEERHAPPPSSDAVVVA
jgi:tetratricopeptide (TPR) repeat protein